MRGVPGCGKSSFLQDFFPEFKIASADHHRMVEGKYVFKPEDNQRIHNACFRDFMRLLRTHDSIAIDNTNSKVMEFAPYYRLAEVEGYIPTIIYLPCNPTFAFNRNVHQVPLNVITTMANSMDPIPPTWNQVILTPGIIATGMISNIQKLVFGG
jgi:predicted kinase